MHKKAFFTILAIVFVSACEPTPPEWMTDQGQIIYLGFKSTDTNCSRCHGKNGQGGFDGEDIRQAVEKKGLAKVKEIVANGIDDEEDEMPAFKELLSPQEIQEVIEYITFWQPTDSVAADTLQWFNRTYQSLK